MIGVDLYTKAVLTVIAASLFALAVQGFTPAANAEGGIQKVAICDTEYSWRCARVGEASKDGSEPTTVLLVVDYGR